MTTPCCCFYDNLLLISHTFVNDVKCDAVMWLNRLWVKAGPSRPKRLKAGPAAGPGSVWPHAPIFAPPGVAASDGQDIPGLKNVIRLNDYNP